MYKNLCKHDIRIELCNQCEYYTCSICKLHPGKKYCRYSWKIHLKTKGHVMAEYRGYWSNPTHHFG